MHAKTIQWEKFSTHGAGITGYSKEWILTCSSYYVQKLTQNGS